MLNPLIENRLSKSMETLANREDRKKRLSVVRRDGVALLKFEWDVAKYLDEHLVREIVDCVARMIRDRNITWLNVLDTLGGRHLGSFVFYGKDAYRRMIVASYGVERGSMALAL